MPQVEHPLSIRAPLPACGWDAMLDLDFEYRGATTVLAGNRHVGPLAVQKALYPESQATCHVAVLHPPGGIAAGDQLRIGTLLNAGARALLTTPGATKWYRSEAETARQAVTFRVHADSVLEWLPRENILFKGSNVSTSLEVVLAPHAKYFGWEILSFGRRASGERWDTGRLQMRTSIRRDAQLLWSEVADLDAGSGFARSSVGLAGFTACGTFVVAGCEIGDELLAACRAVGREPAPPHIGITRLPSVLLARCLGHCTEEIFNWFTDLWAMLRPVLTHRAACAPRVWAC